MSVKVSVIIPVFNAESHLNQCIESLVNQTLSDCEFIFVNDGSTDRSQKIIERYQKMDSRIKLINQENQGVSAARNAGLDVAIGEYIGFVDADDEISPLMYKRLYKEVVDGKCDAVFSNICSEMNGTKHTIEFPFKAEHILEKVDIQTKILPFLIQTDRFNSVCNKLFNARMIKHNNIQFPNKLPLGEDGVFNLRFFCCASRVTYIREALYIYNDVDGSATRNIIGKDYFFHSLESYKRSLPELENIMGIKQVNRLKALKLIQNVMAFIHLYFHPSEDLDFNSRYKYVKRIVRHPMVKEALSLGEMEYRQSIGRYEKLMLQLIKNQFTIGLYGLTAYSRFRNSKR